MSPFLGSGLTSFLTQGSYSPDNFVQDRFLSKKIFRRGRSPAFHALCEKVACVSGARETYIGAQITKAHFSPRAVPPSLAPNIFMHLPRGLKSRDVYCFYRPV